MLKKIIQVIAIPIIQAVVMILILLPSQKAEQEPNKDLKEQQDTLKRIDPVIWHFQGQFKNLY